MGLGKCRECGREVSTSAGACPGCGVKNPTAGAGSRAFALASVFVVLFIAYRCATKGERTPTAAALAGVEPAAAAPRNNTIEGALAARELLADYTANEVKADLKYKGKRYRITGTVAGISSGIGDEPHVHLERELMGVDALGISKANAAAFSKGDAFAADCTVTGEVIGSPVVDCSR